ncbi:isochorismate synthase [Flavobacterium sp.]|uniref:isochorismate synthase n=1 Tax=Flavobacterium sp. TaxID=239 RepID=UPI002604A514|nr:isochorismate synthase [Flavobacterium sp.]MDD3005391.1 isochorismate synthase [Flavobacterium sp.]
MNNIFNKVHNHYNQNLPFVVYAKPNSTDLIAFLQQDKQLHTTNIFNEKGFVFADFESKKTLVFREQDCEIHKATIDEKVILNFQEEVDVSVDGKANFESLVQKGIQFIQDGNFQKVVVSRKESLKKDNFDWETVFQKLLKAYPSAFRYCWFHPEIGMWMGATPEQLLKVENSRFKTVALAGTQKYNPLAEAVWLAKERQEQQFVTDFILKSIESEVVSMDQTAPYTFRAGNLIHLKTDIEGIFKSDFNLKKVIELLHPTPAVCGLPKQASKAFILKEEGYERKFYSGFLGELNKNFSENREGDTDLFVNLRCMEIQQNNINLYIGCGITIDSNPEKEYFETANKALTMKQILN